jgi:hypothetical protein
VVLLIVDAIVCAESEVGRRGSVGRDELKVERRRTVEERRGFIFDRKLKDNKRRRVNWSCALDIVDLELTIELSFTV